jgi:hypothetical protein
MPEVPECSWCGSCVDQHGLARFLAWAGARYAFCSYRCEFFWRRGRNTNHTITALMMQSSAAPMMASNRLELRRS